MGQATHAPTTRRSLLADCLALSSVAGASAILIGEAVSAEAPPPDGPDARLLELGRLLAELWVIEDEIAALQGWDAPGVKAIGESIERVVIEIEQASATTLPGILVKARACAYCHSGVPFTNRSFGGGTTLDARLVGTIVRDLLAIGGET